MGEERMSYFELKDSLPAPARRVVEELIDANQAPEHVLQRLVCEEGCDIFEAYGYVREVLARSLMEMTGAGFRTALSYSLVAAECS